MASYPQISFVDLSNFSGRPIEEYPVQYSGTAISQATLLFKIATCLSALPDESVKFDLAKMGMVALAESFVLSQPYSAAKASPFTSETIGSYSYSKMAQAIAAKEKTGVFWFDLAVNELSVCDANDQSFFSGGIEVMEFDGEFTKGSGGEGNIRLLSDRERDQHFSYLSVSPTNDPYRTLGE